MTQPQRGSAGLMFARTLEQKSGRARSIDASPLLVQSTPAYALGALVLLSCATLLIQTRPDLAQNAPAGAKKQPAARGAKRVQVAMGDRDTPPAKAAETSRPSLEFYTKGVRGSLFSAPVPAAPKSTAENTKKLLTVKVPPLVINPFADYVYTGTITSGDKKLALLENRYTKEGHYVQVGQPFD